MNYYFIEKRKWEETLVRLLGTHNVYAQTANEFSQDYEKLTPELISSIIYNKPKPVTPLKNFFNPVKENVTSERKEEKPRIIIGVPNCDVQALNLLDEIYLDATFEDIFYRNRRENTLIISSDCFDIQEHCHCISLDIKPYADSKADLSVIEKNSLIIFRAFTEKGSTFLSGIESISVLTDQTILSFIGNMHREIEGLLHRANSRLPGYRETGELIRISGNEIWKKHSEKCVSCGACTTICPTCSCFTLIDKPGFHKVKQMDACQYPGFERVAGGEDSLNELPSRFRNRYMCKYVWKPAKFHSTACTGCGRCIEACIGKINKNEIFMEMAK